MLLTVGLWRGAESGLSFFDVDMTAVHTQLASKEAAAGGSGGLGEGAACGEVGGARVRANLPDRTAPFGSH